MAELTVDHIPVAFHTCHFRHEGRGQGQDMYVGSFVWLALLPLIWDSISSASALRVAIVFGFLSAVSPASQPACLQRLGTGSILVSAWRRGCSPTSRVHKPRQLPRQMAAGDPVLGVLYEELPVLTMSPRRNFRALSPYFDYDLHP